MLQNKHKTRAGTGLEILGFGPYQVLVTVGLQKSPKSSLALGIIRQRLFELLAYLLGAQY